MSDLQQKITTDRRGPILVITVNRPEVKNSVDYTTACQLEEAADMLDDLDELFLGVITGAGGNFSAGADLKAQQNGSPPSRTEKRGGFGFFKRPPKKPMIAAIEGYAVGGGLELALSCDMIVAAENAKFGLPEVRHNVVAVGGGLFRLPRRIPYHVAMEMALTGTFRDAASLERWGLINHIVPEGQALEEAVSLANSMLSNGPTALAATKEIIFKSATSWATEEEGWGKQMVIANHAFESEDRVEGINAFVEKRKPVWKGR